MARRVEQADIDFAKNNQVFKERNVVSWDGCPAGFPVGWECPGTCATNPLFHPGITDEVSSIFLMVRRYVEKGVLEGKTCYTTATFLLDSWRKEFMDAANTVIKECGCKSNQ